MFVCVRNASGTYLQFLGGSVRETADVKYAARFQSAEAAMAAGKEMPGFWSPAWVDDGPDGLTVQNPSEGG